MRCPKRGWASGPIATGPVRPGKPTATTHEPSNHQQGWRRASHAVRWLSRGVRTPKQKLGWQCGQTPGKPYLECQDVRAEYCSQWQSRRRDDLSALARMKIFPLELGSDCMLSVTLEAGGKLPPSRRVMVYLSPVPSL